MSSPSFPSAFLSATIFLTFLPLTTAFNYTDFCSYQNPDLDYNPFHPWPKSILNLVGGSPNTNMACWYYADCIFSLIPDTRKQQYAATSLVMGLIPLILKDVAWPHRRIAYIPRLQPWYIEILVRGLGLNPIVPTPTVQKEDPIPYGRKFEGLKSLALFLTLFVALLSSYGALAVIEIFSKRSALGCPYPAFIVSWFIAGLVPATIEVVASRWRKRNDRPSTTQGNADVLYGGGDNTKGFNFDVSAPEPEPELEPNARSEGIQGSRELLFVQFSWAIYYTAGTLVFTSIMLVTVLELFVWVCATCAATAASKTFAYKLCGYWGSGFKR
jgi:hypothetical protein